MYALYADVYFIQQNNPGEGYIDALRLSYYSIFWSSVSGSIMDTKSI